MTIASSHIDMGAEQRSERRQARSARLLAADQPEAQAAELDPTESDPKLQLLKLVVERR